jgi:hypothetical protein
MVKHETSIAFYGGVNEIGGNRILVKDGDTKVFFDFGMSFGMKNQFYSPHFSHRKAKGACRNQGFFPDWKVSTDLTRRNPRWTQFLCLTDTWIIPPTCRSSNVRYLCTAAKQPKPF